MRVPRPTLVAVNENGVIPMVEQPLERRVDHFVADIHEGLLVAADAVLEDRDPQVLVDDRVSSEDRALSLVCLDARLFIW